MRLNRARRVRPQHQPGRSRGRPWTRSLALAVVAALLLSVLSADAAYAQAQSVKEVLTNIRNWLAGLLALLATVFVMIGGTRYMLAGGDPSEAEKGKSALKAAAFGYMLAALASVVVSVLQRFVGL